MKPGSRAGEDERISALRSAIVRAFPAVSYTGPITRCDGAWLPELTEENAIHDDDMFVYQALCGRIWPEVEDEIFQTEPDGLVLLTDEALVAYLAAWLNRALDNFDGENEVREFVVYSFSPRPDLIPDMTGFKVNRIRASSLEQRSVLRSILKEFAERDPSSSIRKHAADAVALVDSVN